MESIIFLTTLSAFLTTPFVSSTRRDWMNWMNMYGNKLSRMKESQASFTIKVDNKSYTVYRIVQSDESVIFIVEVDGRKIRLFRVEDDSWIGDADQELINKIGRGIEEA